MESDILKMLLAAIVSGALGLLLYVFHNLSRDLREVAHEGAVMAKKVERVEAILEYVSRRKDYKETRREGDTFL